MAIGATSTQCGNAPSAVSSASWTLTSTASLDAGEVGVLRVGLDNISAVDGDNNEVVSITGGSGTWTKLGEYTNSQGGQALGVTVSAWVFIPSGSNPVGTVFTITLSGSRTQKVAALEKWSVGAGKGLQQTTEAAYIVSQIDAGAGFGSSAYTGLTNKERLYLRVLGAEMSTTSSVAATSGFTALSTFRSSTSSPISLLGEFDVATSTGETSNPSFTPTADKAGMFFALEEYDLVPGGSGVSGSASAQLDNIQGSGNAGSVSNGTTSNTFGSLGSSNGAVILNNGAHSSFFGSLIQTASANSRSASSASGNLAGIQQSSVGGVAAKASSNGTLAPIALGSQGSSIASAGAAFNPGGINLLGSASAHSEPVLTASFAGTFGSLGGSGSTTSSVSGSSVTNIEAVTTSGSTSTRISALASSALRTLGATGSGSLESTVPSLKFVRLTVRKKTTTFKVEPNKLSFVAESKATQFRAKDP